jgi:hypothetical protein
MGTGLARLAPLTGVLAILLGILGEVLFQTWGDEPASDAPAAELAAWMNGKEDAIFCSTWVWLLAGLAFLWFLGSLRSVLRRVEGAQGRVSAIATGGGIVAVAMFFGSFSGLMAGSTAVMVDDRVVSPALAESLYVYGYNGFFLLIELAAGVVVLATAIVTLRGTGLPKWYGWLGLLYGIWLLILPIGWIGFIGFPIWILLTTGLVWMAESKSPMAPAAVTT